LRKAIDAGRHSGMRGARDSIPDDSVLRWYELPRDQVRVAAARFAGATSSAVHGVAFAVHRATCAGTVGRSQPVSATIGVATLGLDAFGVDPAGFGQGSSGGDGYDQAYDEHGENEREQET
jgi:hypothetical protein